MNLDTLVLLFPQIRRSMGIILCLVSQVSSFPLTTPVNSAQMYAHIYSRSTTHIEMRRIVEVPLHIESKLNTNIQFADWICAAISRASHYQLARDSEFAWAAKLFGDDFHGHFTHESKLHTRVNEAEVHHSELFQETRPRFPQHNLRAIGSQHPQLQKFYDTLRTQTTTEFSESPQ